MKSRNLAPQSLLMMNLRLRRGLEYQYSAGAVKVSFGEELEPTYICEWQHRFMLSLNGKRSLVDVVQEVETKFPGQFDSEDVWDFLSWLMERKLLADPGDFGDWVSPVVVPRERVPFNAWVRIPLQAGAVLVTGLCIMYFTYLATPYVFAFLSVSSYPDPIEEIENSVRGTEERRVPVFVKARETEVSGMAGRMETVVLDVPEEPAVEPEVELPKSEAVVDRGPDLEKELLAMRQELAQCQILRDEYYRQNDEAGYRREVARISELAREIGAISSTLED